MEHVYRSLLVALVVLVAVGAYLYTYKPEIVLEKDEKGEVKKDDKGEPILSQRNSALYALLISAVVGAVAYFAFCSILGKKKSQSGKYYFF
jgi:hypothetical protein